MVSDGSKSRVVARWTEPNAPTGEGDRYQTEDGRIWRVRPACLARADGYATGAERGTTDGSYVYRK